MARIYSFQRTLTLEPTVDSLRSEVDTLQISINSFTKSQLTQQELPISTNGQIIFLLNTFPLGNKILLTLNGQLLTEGTDYSLNSKTINTTTQYILEASDILVASYLA